MLSLVLSAGAAQDKGGIRMNYSRIAVDNLPIGHTVSMKQLVNLPLKIGNRFEVPIEATITIRPPVTPLAGYERIPDTNWVHPGSCTVEVPAQGEAELDVEIMVPNDEALLGRRFHADVIIKTGGNRNIKGFRTGYELTGNLLFSVAPQRNEKALQAALEHPVDAAFLLDPPRVDLFEVQAGQTVVVQAPDQKSVRLLNESKSRQTYTLEPVPAKRAAYRPDAGSQANVALDAVQLAWTECSLDSGAATNLAVSIHVPATTDFQKGPLLYLVAVRNGQTRGIEQYLKIYLWNEPKPIQKQY